MRVSWLIPVRDGGTWLDGAVRSALEECGPDDEVVVVDDGSRDGAVRCLAKDPRLRVFEEPPRGIAQALQYGLRRCRGTFVARLDADDEVIPGRVMAQLDLIESEPGLAVVGGQARLRWEGPEPTGMLLYVDWVNGVRDPHPVMLVESALFHSAVMFRRRAVEAVGGYRDGDLPEDYDLWLRLAEAGWRLWNVEREVVELRDHPARLTRTDTRYRREAFRDLKMGWIERVVLAGRHRSVAVWGGGRTGRPWIRFLQQAGQSVPAVFDLRSGGTRQGVPVLDPERIRDVEFDLLIVAVGVRGARSLIRDQLARLRPDLVEGVGWWAVA